MGRREYQHVVLKCNKGINQQRDLAVQDECADALNVWAPNGSVEQRPGYTGVVSLVQSTQGTNHPAQIYISQDGASFVNAAEGASLTLNSWAVNDQWYIGLDEITDLGSGNDYEAILGIKVLISATNTTRIHYKADYYDGTDWKYLAVAEHQTVATGKPVTHLGSSTSCVFSWVTPGDWATTTVNSQTKYFIRFTLLGASKTDGTNDVDVALDSSVALNNDATGTYHRVANRVPDNAGSKGLFCAQFPRNKRYISIFTGADGVTQSEIGNSLDLENKVTSLGSTYNEDTLATIAVFPQFGEAFIAQGGEVTVHDFRDDYPAAGNLAEVEDGEFAVGEFQPYDPTLVVQLGDFPKARFICNHKQRIFCAGITGERFTVRWSAGSEFYKVFSTLSADPLVEDDNSPITGMHPLGEYVQVFKNDSIWSMVAVGPNSATMTEDFAGIKVVSGVGCVANQSIQTIRNSLMLLAEDGIYAYDGTPNVKKMSDRISDTIASITPTKRHLASSVNWRSKSLYLLSVPTGGSVYNNTTIVYDYKNDSWWLWDIPAKIWLRDEDPYDQEILYFVNNLDQVYRMDTGNEDYGTAISSHILTQRLGEAGNVRMTVRQLEILSNKATGNLTVSVRSNDDESNESSGTLALSESTDAVYGTAVSGSATYVVDRRRARKLSFREQGDWVQVKVSHSDKNKPALIAGIDIGISGALRR